MNVRPQAVRLLVFASLVLVTATTASSDPRWWQHARRITGGTAPTAMPDVSFVFGEGAGGAGLMAVAYEETSPVRGDQDVFLLFSSDYGCSFCAPKLWAGATTDETRPRVEVGMILFQYLSIHVVYERDGDVLVAYDATIDTHSAIPLCEQLAALTPTVRTLSRPRLSVETDSRPRITKASNGTSFLQLHATWQRLGAGAPSVEYANDLAGDGSSWTSPGRDLTADLGRAGMQPDIAGDAAASAFGVGAVSLFFQDPAASGVRMSRSNANGAVGTWLPGALVVSTTAQPLGIAAESSSTGWGETAAWTGAVWVDAVSDQLWFDAGLWTGTGTTLFPDFNPTGDHAVSGPTSAAGGDPAISIGPARDGTERVELFAFWSNQSTPAEIMFRSGMMDPQILPYRDLDVVGFAPVRVSPPDPVVSTPSPFTMCGWNETTGNCDPVSRGPGSTAGAREVSSAMISVFGNAGIYAVVFTDDRVDADPQVYLTLSDDRVDAPLALRAATSCEALLTAKADVSFEPLLQCPARNGILPEFMERYHLYYGTSGLGGPFPGRTTLAAAGLSGAATLSAPSLSPSTSYDFVVIGEDEARNLSPADFNPAGNANIPVATQATKATTPSCSPALALNACTFVDAQCAGVPDPTPRPGDVVRFTLRLGNTGDWAATAVTGTVVATGGTVIAPAAGDLAALGLSIPSFASVDIAVDVRLDLGCAAFGLALTGLASDAGVVTFARLDCPSPLIAIDCSSECGAGCLVGSIAELGTLVGVRSGATGADFSWSLTSPDGAIEYHLNSVATKSDLVDPGPHRAPAVGGVGVAECNAYPPALSCVDPDALASPPDVRFYRAVGACSPLGTDEGPL